MTRGSRLRRTAADARPDACDPYILMPPDGLDPLPLLEAFERVAPLEVDVGCGKGRFLAARARAFPGVNFLGVDRQLVRLRKTSRKLVREGLTNVRLLKIEAAYSARYLLPPASVSAFYILFPDPWPKRRHHVRRLFSEEFLDDAARALHPGGLLHAATDHMEYFRTIEAALARHPAFERTETFVTSEEEQTDFERIFIGQGLEIGRCSFRRVEGWSAPALPPEPRSERRT